MSTVADEHKAALENLALLKRQRDEAEQDVRAIEKQIAPLKKCLKEARERVKAADARLRDAMAHDAEGGLFNGGLKPMAAASGWADTPVTALGLDRELEMLLAAAGLKTVGDLSDWHRDHKGFRDIPGFGKAETGALEEAMQAWFLGRVRKADG